MTCPIHKARASPRGQRLNTPGRQYRKHDFRRRPHHLYLSQYMVLEPGDLINTGTPAGVALGLPDHPYLRPGDRVDLEIDGLGRQSVRFVAAEK